MDQVFCFCCKLFEFKHIGQLCNEEIRDWKNISSKIRNHETPRFENEIVTNKLIDFK